MENAIRATNNSRAGFAVATITFVVAFVSSNVPVPLYATIQAANPSITDAHVSLTMFTYLLGVTVMLLFSGRLSDAIGRKAPTVACMLFGAIGCAMFLRIDGAVSLLTARLMQGIACGLAMGPVSALIIDLADERHEALARTIVGTFAMLGVSIGSVSIGLWNLVVTDYAPVLIAVIVLQVICAAAVLVVPETVPKDERIPLASVVRAPISIPKNVRSVFPVAAIAYVSAWGMGTYYQAFSSLVAADTFGNMSTLLAAIVLSLAMCPSCLGGPLEARLPKGVSLRVGMWLFLASTIAMCVFMSTTMLVPFLASVGVFSLSMGISLSGSLRILFAADPHTGSASIISSINLAAYVGCSVLNAGMSAIVNDIGLFGTLLAVSALCVASVFMCVFLSKRMEKREQQVAASVSGHAA
ncbi:MFS transporter [Adlercreutzia sp. ZJ141]|uniref:MFS transporter n=1 Tax=Adlercreutzia sp. ZJ141 TaxID=2709406 RepID=UPI0013EB9499|nr:MFS transporter [Adlercreutzia sp. ZJ141]